MNIVQARDSLVALGSGVEPVDGEIKLDLTGPVARLWIDNPRARNAITIGMMVQLADAVIALQQWDGAALILGATQTSAFCSGGHLGQVLDAVSSPGRALQMAAAMGTVLDAVLDLPQVSVAAVGGAAIGGGAELCTATDYRVASPSARIHFVHAALAIAPGWGGAGRLVRHVGRSAALDILGRARPIGPDEAVDLGLVSTIAPDPVAGAMDLLAPFLRQEAQAARAVKRQVAAAEAGSRAAEAEAFSEVWGTPAHLAALEAARKA